MFCFLPAYCLPADFLQAYLRPNGVHRLASLVIVLLAGLGSSVYAQDLPTQKKTLLPGHYIVSLHSTSALERSDIVEQLRSFRTTRKALREAGASGRPLRLPAQFRRDHLASDAFQVHLQAARSSVERARVELSALLGRDLKATTSFAVSSTGFATELSASEVARLLSASEVKAVEPIVLWPLNTDVSSTFLGAVDIWSGSATGLATKGAGMLLGFIDSGIQRDHQSFGASAGVINPYGPGIFKGLCVATPALCNDKLVGIWDYEGGSPTDPTDDAGHGSHVASIAVGNELVAGGSPTSPLPSITGIAPLASLISYDACTRNINFQTNCSSASIMAAIDQAILDGVDVLNISIRGGVTPWAGAMAESTKLLNAFDIGMVVVGTAGNDGPGASSVSRLDPWVITVASTSHTRKPYTATLTPVDGVAPPAPLTVLTVGEALGTAMTPLEVVYDGAGPGPGDCEPPVPPVAGAYAGKIVFCDRVAFDSHPSVKAAALEAIGASGMVTLSFHHPYPSVIPNSRTSSTAEGNLLRAWAVAGAGPNGGPKAYITGASLQQDTAFADIVPIYSSRGPVTSFDLLKPDLAAPGQFVLGAEYDDRQYGPPSAHIHVQYQRGTSMAAPQVAGTAALLLSLDPTLTPAQVKSIVQTTAVHAGIRKCDAIDFPEPCAVTPVAANIFDYGSGRLAIVAAAKAGLALNETRTNFENADPTVRGVGDPATLNLASMAKRDCPGGCAFRRTLDGITSSAVSWTATFTGKAGDPLPANLETHVVPATFDLSPLGQQAVMIGIYATAPSTENQWQQLLIELAPSDGAISTARLPIVIKPSSSSPSSDLAVEVAAITPFFAPGDAVEFSVTVTNLGAIPAVGASITAALPIDTAGASWTCAAPGDALCGLSSGNGAISAELALLPGASITFSFLVADTSAVTSESISFTANVASPTGLADPASGNDTSFATISKILFSDGFESGNTNAWN